ncbi:hypothetical protein O7614_26765 [Micromonospora sp. WMMD961]|uniref:hypothetical protein n=1 Tax=Micromonospora sp. WMMD961 TaxID=3016100 RepID=UPI002415E92D|nr:hypothetical protein [Micromonospora sp. WMMD961]MDG4783268.1 hypothetical protein [Micromonospora sp. WMMD961]
MATTRDAATIAFDLLNQGEGGTVTAIVGQRVPTTGYAVGQHGIKVTETGPDLVKLTEEWVAKVLPEVAFHGLYLGVWVHEGVTYLDVVRVHSEITAAFADANKRGELAIYDLGAGRTIYQADYILA